MDKLTRTSLERVLAAMDKAADTLRAVNSMENLQAWEIVLDARCSLAEARGFLGAMLKGAE